MFRLHLVVALLFTTSTVATAQWTIQESHATADLRDIHSIGNGIAWASGTNGTVLRTIDGGTTWQTCSIPPGAEALDFRSIKAFTADTAIVMSSAKGECRSPANLDSVSSSCAFKLSLLYLALTRGQTQCALRKVQAL